MRLLASLGGAVLVILTLWDVFAIVVVTRRATRQLQLTAFLISNLRDLLISAGRHLNNRAQRENYLGILGPLLLFLRFGLWSVVLILGYALLQWGAGGRIASPDGSASFSTLLYYSGTTFFTVALGDIAPQAAWPRFLNVTEAATGFLFLGLVISYLPAFYSDYARRETRIALLDARAGSPPTAAELLSRYSRDHNLPGLNVYFADWEAWSADMMESHLSYPILALLRSQHEDQSWVSALATLLDASILVLVGIEGVEQHAARLAFAMARHATVDLSQVFGHPRREPEPDRLPPLELARLRAHLSSQGVLLAEGPEADARLQQLRTMYEPYLYVLSTALFMPLPSWVPDRDARDNWQRTA